jgi:hypothetical protein
MFEGLHRTASGTNRLLTGAEVLPAEALDLVNLTAGQVVELCPDAEAEIDGHEQYCPAVTFAPDSAFPEAIAISTAAVYPSVDESFARLHRAGWSIGEAATESAWIVSGTNGENAIRAEATSQAEAWHRAVEQAEAVGMARRNYP